MVQRLPAVDLEVLFGPAGDQARIALAVSGGLDSMALMDMAARWANGRGRPGLIIYTVDHGLRAESAAEADFVLKAAASLGLPSRILRWHGGKPATGLQEAARTARYQLLADAMRADGAGMLLTAHHRDDQAETVLMRLGHGSGIAGLGGMRVFSHLAGVDVFRPLLGLSKSDLLDVAQSSGLGYVSDPSNADQSFERVRWRRASPMLEQHGLGAATLERFARRVQRAEGALEAVAAESFERLARMNAFGTLSLPRPDLLGLPDEIALRVLIKALEAATGQEPQRLAQVEALLPALASNATHRTTLAGALVQSRADDIRISREVSRIPGHSALEPGEACVWDRRFRIQNIGTQSFVITPCHDLTRPRSARLLGRDPGVPMAELHGAPLVRSTEGSIMALGFFTFSNQLSLSHALYSGPMNQGPGLALTA